MDRTACAFVPRYELALRGRADPGILRRPTAVADLAGPGRLGAVSPIAEALGVTAGQLAVSARARCPELEIFAPDAALLAAGERDVLAALDQVSPLLDSDGRGAFFVGTGGLERLVASEAQLAARIREAVGALGLPVRVAVADGAFTAWVAARRARPVAIVPRGGDAALLDAVPLGELPLGERTHELCALLGLTDAGAVAALPPGELARRLGREGAELERMLGGAQVIAWPREGRAPPSPETVSLEIDPPMDDLEPLVFMGKSMIDRIVAGLGRRRLVELGIVLSLDDRSVVTHALRPAEPAAEARPVVDLYRLWLEQAALRAPVVAIDMTATATAVATARQLSLYHQKEEKEADALRTAVARLTAAFGQCAMRPVLADTYRPEARIAWVPFSGGARGGDEVPARDAGTVVRLFDPEPVDWRGDTINGAAVTHIDGPHCVAGDWWATGYDRRYYWLTLADGALIWVYRDRDGRSFLHGVAD